MRTSNPSSLRPTSLTSGHWWVCALTACLLAFQVTYLRVHLLAEPHHGAAPATGTHGDHDSGGHHEDGDHEHDTHQPHSAGDHELQPAGKQQSFSALVPVVLPATSIFLTSPEALLECSLFERRSRPGESPPGARQPRAPPTV